MQILTTHPLCLAASETCILTRCPGDLYLSHSFEKWCRMRHSIPASLWESVIHPRAFLTGWLLNEVKSWGCHDSVKPVFLVTQDYYWSPGDPRPFPIRKATATETLQGLADTQDLSLGDPSRRPLTGQPYIQEVAEVQCTPNSRFLNIPAHYLPSTERTSTSGDPTQTPIRDLFPNWPWS